MLKVCNIRFKLVIGLFTVICKDKIFFSHEKQVEPSVNFNIICFELFKELFQIIHNT